MHREEIQAVKQPLPILSFISFVRRLVADQRANVYEIPGKGAFLPIEIEFAKRGSTCFCVIGQNETNRIERIGFRIGAEVPAFVLLW